MVPSGGGCRFSLLLLEDDEFYITECVCMCEEDGTSGQLRGGSVAGQLRVCTKSVFFEPDDVRIPVMRIPYVSMDELEGNASENGIRVVAHRYTTMKPQGRDAPYTFCRGRQVTWRFRLSYAKVADIIPYAQQMLMSSRLGRNEMKEMHDVFLSQLEAEQRFDLGSLEDPTCERIVFEKPAMLVSRLTKERGKFVVTDVRFYFQPLHNISGGEHVRSHRLSAVYAAARRRSSLRDVGIELFLKMPAKRRTTVKHWGCSNAFFVFRSKEEREEALGAVLDHVGEDGSIAGGLLEAEGRYCQVATMAWQRGLLSNFEYLMYCNLAAGRSFHDLTQYPVFPWIIKDYTSDEIDLNCQDIFRDLSKPIGAINEERLKVFQQRYADMVEMQMHGGEEPFLYGTHYSCPGYTLFWLVRSMPEHMLRLQNGKFDAPDRSFTGIREAWESVCHSPTDVKELIPEFFCPGAEDFLKNSRGLALGCRQNGKPVGDVELPPWAHNDARYFLEKQWEALESPYVSANLHHWIDLVFGVCQRGEDALRNNNVFRQLTYEGLVNIDDIEDPVEKRSMEVAVAEFGQCPRQIFYRNHPQRRVCRSSFEAHEKSRNAMDGSEIIAKVLHVVQSLLESPPDGDDAASNDSDIALLHALEVTKEEYSTLLETMDSKKERSASGSTTDSQSSFQQRLQTVVSSSKRAGSNLLKYGNEALAAKVSSSLQALSPRKNGSRKNDASSPRQDDGPHLVREQGASWETSVFSGGLTSVEINPLNPSDVSISFQDGHILVFDLLTKEHRRRCALSHGSITCTAWSSQNILASGFDGAIYKYDTNTGSTSAFRAHSDIVSCLCTSDESSLVYSASWDETIKVWDLETAPWGQYDDVSIPLNTIASPAGAIWSMEVLLNDSIVAATLSAECVPVKMVHCLALPVQMEFLEC
ncbi:hypothetical protein M9434_003061 [Picochlorum sp. BPE23]|nr:hypothetical protein M9434_003061 [Picochlorum sp. BPE23]